MLLGTLGASMFGNMLTGKGVKRAGKGVVTVEAVYNARYHMGKYFQFCFIL